MPRRTGRVCGKRSSGVELAAPDEWSMIWWGGLDIVGMGLETTRAFTHAWEQHGDEIKRQWVSCMPGSRAFGCYVMGEIEPPPLVMAPAIGDAGRYVADKLWHAQRCYGIWGWPEFDHLCRLGVIDDDEHDAAVERLKNNPNSFLYRWLSSPTPTRGNHAEAKIAGATTH